ncbi:MAG TPA: hypothetical protein DCE41_23715 [Cytophagales bacterium]|nr:hypothetical protein [Cytophagales bacterium]HAA18636.1 hypothetical protein [Cytophagales bacterium]HAP64576.1 hypothetical protein [Cytophagales bacterium]
MEVKDLFITPIYIVIVLGLAFTIRPLVTTQQTQKYFFPALLLKIFGAIVLGLIYQFYYQGGDTFTYYTHGTQHIWEAFLDRPSKALKLIFLKAQLDADTVEFSRQIWTYYDPASYFVVRVGGIFSLVSFNTYSTMAILFSVFSFSGGWAMYRALLKFYPQLHLPFAVAIFFIPSVVFWGSGLLKDTLTLGALGWLVWAIVGLFFVKRRFVIHGIIALSALYIIYSIKIYIVLCFIPAAILWVGYDWYSGISRMEIKILVAPLVLAILAGFSYLLVTEIGQGDERYSIDNLGRAAEVTARWINFVSEKEGGAGYTLGDFDYSPVGIARKTLPAIFVTLYQPFLWQASNPVMLISALESFALLMLTLWILVQGGWKVLRPALLHNSLFLFAFLFSLSFAAAVGFSTYNFGSLVRYKIPLLPLFGIVLTLLWYYAQKNRQQGKASASY